MGNWGTWGVDLFCSTFFVLNFRFFICEKYEKYPFWIVLELESRKKNNLGARVEFVCLLGAIDVYRSFFLKTYFLKVKKSYLNRV